MMTLNIKLNKLLILALPLILAACAPEKLNDDPENEPLAPADNVAELPSTTPPVEAPPAPVPPDEKAQILAQYDHVDPTRLIPTKALEEALLYYHANKATLGNKNTLSIIDFGQSSTKKRWFIIDMVTGSVWNVHVSHGKGSDSNHDGFAEKFSNVSGSNATSLGFYKTAETYQGKHGYSLRLDGLSETNSRARQRAIVVHGADYVKDKDVIQGRSWGCPAISLANYAKVINLIKGGSIIYATK